MWTPDLETVLLAMCFVFGPGLLLLAAGIALWQRENEENDR